MTVGGQEVMLFRDLAVGSYFFRFYSTVPFYKIEEEYCVEGGSAYNEKIDPNTRVVPITPVYEGDPPRMVGMKFGYHTVPGPVLDGAKAEAYRQGRLDAESKKG